MEASTLSIRSQEILPRVRKGHYNVSYQAQQKVRIIIKKKKANVVILVLFSASSQSTGNQAYPVCEQGFS